MNEELDHDIQIALAPAPMDREAPEALVRRLRVLAHETPRRARWWRSWPSAFIATSGAVAAIVAVTTLMPAKASAKSFDLIVNAAQQVNAFQFSVLTDEKGKHESITIAGSDGHVYMRMGEGGFMETDTGSITIYDPSEKKVMRFKFAGLADAESIANEVKSGMAEGLKEMNLKKMLQEYRQKYGEKGLRISPVTQEEGRSVYHVTLASPDEPERVEMTVDAASDLPDRLIVESRDGQTWHQSVQMEMRFGSRVDLNLLKSGIPKGAKVEEIDLGAMVGNAMKGIENLGSQFGKVGEKLKSGK